MDKPQIIAHREKSVDFTLFDCKWIPSSAKFVVLGNHARGTGALQVYEVSREDATLIKQVSISVRLKSSGSFSILMMYF